MKFTEDKAYEQIVSKLTNNGKKPLQASERTLKHLLTRYYQRFADEETEIETFISDTITDFEEVNGNVNKDKADFIKAWKEEHPDKVEDTKKVDNTSNGDNPKDNQESKLDIILKEIEAMKAKEANEKRLLAISNKKSELLKAMEEKGIKDKEWAKDFISEITITEDLDVDVKADAYLKIYNRQRAKETSDYTPDNSSRNSQQTNSILDKVAEQIIKDRGNKPKI